MLPVLAVPDVCASPETGGTCIATGSPTTQLGTFTAATVFPSTAAGSVALLSDNVTAPSGGGLQAGAATMNLEVLLS